MGVERVLQDARRRLIPAAISIVAVAAIAGAAQAAPKTRERVAVIDLGPADGGALRGRLAGVVIGAGLEAVVGDGVEDALAGEAADKDTVQLAAAMAEAQRAYGALDCAAATAAAKLGVGIAAARQASGLAVPELPRAWTYALLCADRAQNLDEAMHAAGVLRRLGGSAEIPQDIWVKYPEVDTLLDHELFPLEITTATAGAEVWVDFRRVGVSPMKTFVSSGEHVIAAARGTQRGWAAGKGVKTQTALAIPMADQAAPTAALAARVAGWKGALPSPAELGAVLVKVNARIALIRRGTTLEAWGHIGASEVPRRLGGEDGTGPISDADRLVALISDRVQTWNDRAPDPDQPLLVEDPKDRGHKPGKSDEPTRWWVYGALLGAAAIGLGVMYAYDTAENTQHVELHYP
jgi:hypothetical protein